ncbi:hypothetical protein RY831_05110 [Noviherbaspirillum sp. CPCC 100848]|uniref:Uncharacterized protein n=1 Tax=Noviherbaspirillum album TaxID=3080276 RepID=A0ABU6J4R0_9BURK|nr:hypothetical protein [Noviherbaspirillum sp. CPCC 100848]MEC4718515.1 hypothetical protein [Noviherbaspirillum sp. CPCC 100848]
MRERDNTELAKQAYERFRSGDIPDLIVSLQDQRGAGSGICLQLFCMHAESLTRSGCLR